MPYVHDHLRNKGAVIARNQVHLKTSIQGQGTPSLDVPLIIDIPVNLAPSYASRVR